MTTNNHRSARLRAQLASVKKVRAEVRTKLIAAEDVLTNLEDREARRAARSSRGGTEAKFPALQER